MNTSSLKTFAQDARNKLRAQVAARLNYWLGAEGGTAPDTAAHRQFAPQIRELAEAMKKVGRDALVERTSYTWFNRLIALRFMDANDFHPFGVRVVSPEGANEILPALLQQARAGALHPDIRAKLAAPQTFDDILAGRIPLPHPETELFGMLLLAACNYYHALMPFLFEKLGDATQLLLPEDLLSEQSVLTEIRENLSAEDCREVEVIGWLYQFYISERKDTVMARKTAVPTEDIPAVTQLFTPHWIVRYLVENSLGRLWLLNRPHSRLRQHMPYYIEGEPESDFLKIEKPEDIKLVDPACGSAHMLTYAFDLLYLIYEEEGYDAPEIPSLILRHNLHGLEICDRAAALAAFALCMKARAKDRRFFRRLAAGGEDCPRPHVIELRDVHFAENELRDYIGSLRVGDLFNQPMLKLLHQFEEAKNFGSLIQPCLDEKAITFARHVIDLKDLGGQLFLRETHLKVLRVLEQAEALTQRYHVVVANPPYMGGKFYNETLSEWIKENYPKTKADLCAVFMERCLSLVASQGKIGMINLPSWLFLSTFESLRKLVIGKYTIDSMLHMGRGIFGIDWGSVAFIIAKQSSPESTGQFFRLHERNFQHIHYHDIEKIFLNSKHDSSYKFDFNKYRDADGVGEIPDASDANGLKIAYKCNTSLFKGMPGTPIAYWLSPMLMEAFLQGRPLSSCSEPKSGLSTTDNSLFLRLWHEVAFRRIGFGFTDVAQTESHVCFWYPFNKGGDFRKWWGNNEYVVNWHRNGAAIKEKTKGAAGGRIVSPEYYFKNGVAWSGISSGKPSMRVLEGSVFGSGGKALFSEQKLLQYLGFLNSTVALSLLQAVSPTLNYEAGHIGSLPLMEKDGEVSADGFVVEMVALARTDWDNFETSWDFRDQPLLRAGLKGATLEASWRNWEAQSSAAIRRMQELETENNRLFIAAYGLEGELEPVVPEAQITLARADRTKDMAAFLSYAVGCMMGRYCLDAPGLILANAGDTVADFRSKIVDRGLRVEEVRFAPDEDGIIPVLDGEWFTDDIVGRCREFLKVAFGESSFAANLRFIEDSLGREDAKTGKVKATDLRTYFVRDFYKNHISNERAYGYKKRPIYWMVSSPNGSFQALIYLHRYHRDTLNRVLDGYVRPFLDKLEQRQQACTVISTDAAAKPAARTAAQKELVALAKMLKEIRGWEHDSLLPLAQQRIELDLDDGVKVNYLKFKGVLVPIPGLEKKGEED